MNDLISRSALLEETESLRVTVTGLWSGKGILAEYAKHYRESFLKMIDEQPTVEAIPRAKIDHIIENIEEYIEEAEHYGFSSAISDIIAMIKEEVG